MVSKPNDFASELTISIISLVSEKKKVVLQVADYHDIKIPLAGETSEVFGQYFIVTVSRKTSEVFC